jgi:hypothetical protein
VRVFARLQGDDASRVGGERDFAQHIRVRYILERARDVKDIVNLKRSRWLTVPLQFDTRTRRLVAGTDSLYMYHTSRDLRARVLHTCTYIHSCMQ